MHIHPLINNKTNHMMHSISASLIKPFTKPLIKAGAKLICISLLFITQIAHADFRKALDAYMARDGATMLKEVKAAVDKKNDDGIILFLGILKQYPKTWRPMLNEAQQTELFNRLEKAAVQSGLQAQ